jgi:hypothetical protein
MVPVSRIATQTDERRWREAMEKLGTDMVRAMFDLRAVQAPNFRIRGIVDRAPHPTRRFVEAWLAEKAAG